MPKPQVKVVPAVDPRNDRYRWTVSSLGADDAFIKVQCTDCSRGTPDDPMGVTVSEIEIPREVANMLAMAVIYDQFEVEDA